MHLLLPEDLRERKARGKRMEVREQMTEKSILDMARGEIGRGVDEAMTEALENIVDGRTEAKKTRKIQVTITLRPDESRRYIGVSVETKVSLPPPSPTETSLFIAAADEDEIVCVENVPKLPGQIGPDGVTEEPAPVLRLVRG